MKNKPCDIYVVSHTHWDREWRYPIQTTKMKLLDCMDNVLAIFAKDRDYKHFMCDGQMIMVDDYLDWRPEMREKIQEYTRAGRFVMGPWYSLIDEFQAGPEAVIRNLLWGYRGAEAMGGCLKVGYAPASFGHISQLPQMFAGFGFDTALFSRGLSSHVMPDMEYTWVGPDGTKVLASHMLEDSTKSNFTKWVYLPSVSKSNLDAEPSIENMNGVSFFVCDKDYAPHCMFYALNPSYAVDIEAAYQGILKLKEMLLKRCRVPVLLFLDGIDQMQASPHLTTLMNGVRKRLAETTGDRLVHGTLEDYFAAVKKAVKTDQVQLKELAGEMYHPNFLYGGCGFYPAVAMARLNQHIQNEICSVLLGKWAEPLACFAAMTGAAYPRKPLEAAWRLMFENHTHDCIAGCAVDSVHENTVHRFGQVEHLSRDVIERSLAHLSLQVDLADFGKGELAVLVFNNQPQPASDVVTAQLDFPHGKWVDDFAIFDGDREIPFQTTTRSTAYRLLVKYLDAATGFPLQRFEVTFPVSDVPAMGYKTLRVKYQFGANPGGHKYKDKLTRKHAGNLVTGSNVMENEFLRVQFNPNGTFDLTDKATQRVYRDQHYFEDQCAGGDIWSPILPGMESGLTNTRTAAPRIELIKDGPMLATYALEYEWMLPTHLDKERQAPARERRLFKIRSEISLRKGARRVDIVTRFNNNVEDHILSAMFPTDMKTDVATAELPFDVVTRSLHSDIAWNSFEPFPMVFAQQGFVDVSDGKAGLALLNEGLRAYRVQADERRTAALVLVRAVDAPGIIAAVEKGAQCQRAFICRYAVYPHAGDWEQGRVFAQSRLHNDGLRVIYTTGHKGTLPQTNSFFRISPDTLVLSAVKQSEDGKSFIIRFWNPSLKTVQGALSFYKQPKAVALVDMKEDEIEKLKAVKNGYPIAAGGRKIITVSVRF